MDTSEKGLEKIIVDSLINDNGYIAGDSNDYDKANAVDLTKFIQFIQSTQPKVYEFFRLGEDTNKRNQFLGCIQKEIGKRGIIDVLRKGVYVYPHQVELFYGTPSEGNLKAQELFQKNIFSVTRQLRYSNNSSQLSLDMCIFINGLPIITFELKNSLTKQSVEDAVQQYKRDRDAREPLFKFGRCIVHFALDDQQVKMCTHLKGKDSWFLPFNKGYNDGAGNPPNPNGIATDYLWKEILTKPSLTNIIENYASIIEKENKRREQIFPRYHQLDVVRKLLAACKRDNVGKRYLIQHSAGSGKSNSIAWLVHQLVNLRDGNKEIFDSIIVVTDRRILDKQLRDNIKRFAQVYSIVGAVTEGAAQLRDFLQAGKKIIISTLQKFPFILDEIGDLHRNRKFAIIIDEAHSGQGGRAAFQMNMVLAEQGIVSGINEDELDFEDIINLLIESKKMLSNASYFAFTATPKNKTLEMFGFEFPEGEKNKYRPFHIYSMKQAIQEGFILDVLQNYTPVESYYRLIKAIEEDPQFDKKKANKKLRKYVESHEHAIRQKAEIMIDHFNEQVVKQYKIGGQARAMVVCDGIKRAIQYFYAFKSYLTEIKSPYKPIVAFSGEHNWGDESLTESRLNGFSSNDIPAKFEAEPYRFLIVAEKFQTGFDQPLLHTMYVDKPLSGIKAVQTLSRLNRVHPLKTDTFVLDFYNSIDLIQFAFSDYYRTTILSDKTDPNKLNDLKYDLDEHRIYNERQVDELVRLFLTDESREKLDPILDYCVHLYKSELDEDGQVDFKAKAKSFVRTYNFLASILIYNNTSWEKLSIFLNFLLPKLPAPQEDDLSKGILETIDMESYRVEIQSKQRIKLPDDDSDIDPSPVGQGALYPEVEQDKLSNIIKAFNDLFGNIEWNDADKIRKIIAEELPVKVSSNQAYQNAMKQNDKQNARVEHDKTLEKVILDMFSDQTELYRQFHENQYFKKWLGDAIFKATYKVV